MSNNGRNKPNLLFLLLVLLGCENTLNSEKDFSDNNFLNLSMNHPFDGSFYLVDYDSPKSHWYVSVEYDTKPMTRVFWTSPDSFTIYHNGFPITEPIINYSTYSRDDGSGKQMIYLNTTMIGKVLSIIGCISEDICEVLQFKLE